MRETTSKASNSWGKNLLNLFIVPPASGKVVDYLDGIRGIAVLFILFRHQWGLGGSPDVVIPLPFSHDQIHLAGLITYTASGVDLFFVLSGFLLAQSWLKADFLDRPRPSFKKYFKQRFLRLAPPYYCTLFLILLFFIPSLIEPKQLYSWLGLSKLASHIFFLQHMYYPAMDEYKIATPFWTLSIEMLFYIILPWFILLFVRNRWRWSLPLMIFLSFVWLVICQFSLQPLVNWLMDSYNYLTQGRFPEDSVRTQLGNQILGYLADFAAGITAANLVVRRDLGLANRGWIAKITSVWAGRIYFFAGCAILLYFMNKLGTIQNNYGLWWESLPDPKAPFSFDRYFYYYFQYVPLGIGYGLVIAGVALGGNWLKKIFSIVPLRFIGVIGYSVYLWHMPLIWQIQRLLADNLKTNPTFLTLSAASTPVIIIFASGFYLLVEKPFILLAKGRKVADPAPKLVEPKIVQPERVKVAD